MATAYNAEVAQFVSNINNLVRISLDANNYLIWFRQIRNALRAYDLLGFVDGTIPCPEPLIIVSDDENRSRSVDNPSYALWMKIDRQLLSCIQSTISAPILSSFWDFNHAYELWAHVNHRFSSLSTSHIHELKAKLMCLTKSGTVSEFLKQLKDISDKLMAAGEPMTEVDLVFYTLHGLPSEYNPFKSAIRTRGTPVLFCELCSLLEAEEVNLMRDSNTNPTLDIKALQTQLANLALTSTAPASINTGSSSAYVANKGGFRGAQRGRGTFSYRGHRGRFTGGRGRAKSWFQHGCQICGLNNHQADTCFHRFNNSFQRNSQPPQANFGSLENNSAGASSPISQGLLPNPTGLSATTTPSDSHWFFDTGASHHVTNEPALLSSQQQYHGLDSLSVGNGQGLSIHSVGAGQSNPPSPILRPL